MTKATVITLRDDLRDKFGAESVMLASEIPVREPISSGSLALDFAIGIGGLPADRLVMVAGADSTGKTTLGILAMQNFLDVQRDRCAVIIDNEHKITPSWVEMLIGPERMARVIYLQPDDAEEAISMYASAVSSGDVCFVLFDSIAAAETRRSVSEKLDYGGNALVMGRFARRACNLSAKYHCCTFAVNQVRADMEGYHRVILPGGHAIKHHPVLTLVLKRSTNKVVEEEVDGEKMPIGYWVAVKVVKNQLAPPGRTAGFWFYNIPTPQFGFGIDTLDEVLRLGILTQVVQQRGGWYSHSALPGQKVKGMAALRIAIDADDALRATLVSEIMARLGEHSADVAPISDPDAEPEPDNLRVSDVLLRGTTEVEDIEA